eukprot:TRINITY_DN7376_c0_g1_i3.p1 TRINITY_DN7376_c0_g1~~TRINITY_DN7376_c0_g1_i3.p1  ORF type:complete len:306 (+),score=53.59 TRINITY_DN7376_c0_g1_i3:135-1052(+)
MCIRDRLKKNLKAPFQSLLSSVSELHEPAETSGRSKRARLAQTVSAVCSPRAMHRVVQSARVFKTSEDSLDVISRGSEVSGAKLGQVADSKLLTSLAGAYLTARCIQNQLSREQHPGFGILVDNSDRTGTRMRLRHGSTEAVVTFSWTTSGSVSLQFASRLPSVHIASAKHALSCRVLWATGDSTADVLRRVEQILAQFTVVDAARAVLKPRYEVPVRVECVGSAVLDWVHLRCSAQIGVWVPALRLKISLEENGQIEYTLESETCGIRNCVVRALGGRMKASLVPSVHTAIGCWLRAISDELQS